MTSFTPNLKLLKKDPTTDGNDTFNITTMLNENWDKVDEEVGKKAGVDLSNVLESDLIAALSNVNVARIEMGSYVGTGSAGSDNPNILNFDFTPKFLFVKMDVVVSTSSNKDDAYWGFFINNSNQGYALSTIQNGTGSTGSDIQIVDWSVPNQVSWWYSNPKNYDISTSGFYQLNIKNKTYNYVAIG